MHTYLIVLEITPLKVGAVYDTLPLHCTLVHWFWLKQDAQVVTQRLTQTLQKTPAVDLAIGDEQIFTGKTKQGTTVNVTVNDVALKPALRELHENACTVLEEMGVCYSEPGYVHEGFHPHVTHQKDGHLSPGDTHASTKLYLVEADAPEYGNDRTVKACIDLRASQTDETLV